MERASTGGRANWTGAAFELRLGVEFCVYILMGEEAGLGPGAARRVQLQAPEVIDDLILEFETGTRWAIQAKAGPSVRVEWNPDKPFGKALRQLYNGATSGQIDLAPDSLDRVELAVDHRAHANVTGFGAWLAQARQHPEWDHFVAASTGPEQAWAQKLPALLSADPDDDLLIFLKKFYVRRRPSPNEWRSNLRGRLRGWGVPDIATADRILDVLLAQVAEAAPHAGQLNAGDLRRACDEIQGLPRPGAPPFRLFRRPTEDELYRELKMPPDRPSRFVERPELAAALDTDRGVLVAGRPGSGKSHALIKLALARPDWPVVVVARHFRADDLSRLTAQLRRIHTPYQLLWDDVHEKPDLFADAVSRLAEQGEGMRVLAAYRDQHEGAVQERMTPDFRRRVGIETKPLRLRPFDAGQAARMAESVAEALELALDEAARDAFARHIQRGDGGPLFALSTGKLLQGQQEEGRPVRAADIARLPEGLRKQALGEAREAQAEAQVPPVEPERPERIEIATRALADSPSEVDLLGFSVYAKALADFIKNEKTAKPLTIGIDAAWGMGKTTLMLMIRDQLTEQEKKKKRGRSFPTVWFNAWKYDQEESLWAALALEILAQVRRQFSWWKRAQLWMKLNYRRIDRTLLWRSVLKLLVSAIGIYLLGIVVFVAIAIGLGTDVVMKYANTVGLLGLIPAVYAAGKEIYDRLAGPFDLKIAEFVRKPNYKERIGFLAQFEEDFKRMIDAVTENGRWPLVVFIDDLDRCAPPKPAEIIEAINILLDAKHCVFIIGMDAQAVVGSIEAKYKDLQDYLDDADDPGGLTLGQRFLEKIVQINFRIPRADPKVVKSFVDANLDALRGGPPLEPTEQEVIGAEQLIEAEQRAGKSLDEAAQAVQAARPDIPREVVTKAREEVFAKSFDDSEDVRRAIHEAAPYLGLNPRKIKKFINIFRLQALIANRRGLLETGVIRLDLLAKSLTIAMRWPDMIEAMMTDQNFINSLQEARQTREQLRDWIQSRRITEKEVQQETSILQSRLDVLVADPRTKRLIDATDLIHLLEDMASPDIEALPYYLHLTQSIAERPSAVRTKHE